MKKLLVVLILFGTGCKKDEPTCDEVIRHLVSEGVISSSEGDKTFAECKGKDWEKPWSGETKRCILEKGSVFECDGSGDILLDFEKIKDEMCACKDKECAEKVNKKFEDWLKKNEKAKGSEGQKEKAKKIAEEYVRCMLPLTSST